MATISSLAWKNLGTKEVTDWVLIGSLDDVLAAAEAGQAEVVKVTTTKVDPASIAIADDDDNVAIIRPLRSAPATKVKRSFTPAAVKALRK